MSKAIIFAVLLIGYSAKCQFHFVEKGRIVFERKINTYAILPAFVIESNIAPAAELKAYIQNFRSDNPQFWTDSFQLVFDGGRTVYGPIGKVSNFLHGVGIPVSNENKVYSDLSNATFVAEKLAYNEAMVVKDTIPKIRWKLTSETREIAGYECRRANALIMDSLYVVAFYTDAIKTKGGPESFSGLPGAILGVVLPHYHISYFATKVEVMDTVPAAAMLPTEKAVTQKQFNAAVIGFLKKDNRLNSWTQIFMGL